MLYFTCRCGHQLDLVRLKNKKKNNSSKDNADHLSPYNKVLYNLVSLFAPELISGVSAVRDIAHETLNQISSLSDKPVSELLKPYAKRLMGPVFAQSLHAVPTLVRIGYISCTAYCMSLKPNPLIKVEHIGYLLDDAVKELATKDDDTHVGNVGQRSKAHKLSTLLLVPK